MHQDTASKSGNASENCALKAFFAFRKVAIMDEPSKDLDIPSKVALYNIYEPANEKGHMYYANIF